MGVLGCRVPACPLFLSSFKVGYSYPPLCESITVEPRLTAYRQSPVGQSTSAPLRGEETGATPCNQSVGLANQPRAATV